MQTIQNLPIDYVEVNSSVQEARSIRKLGHREAGYLATVELDRTLSLLETLSGDDWQQPTACTLWNVRQLTAHLSGACASHASWAEFKRVYIQNPYIKEAVIPIDGINRREVEDRADASPRSQVLSVGARRSTPGVVPVNGTRFCCR